MFDTTILVVISVLISFILFADLEDTVYGFPLSSLTLVEEVTKQVTEKVTKQIDWEQRRWELASKFYLDPRLMSAKAAIEHADILIEDYKQTLK